MQAEPETHPTRAHASADAVLRDDPAASRAHEPVPRRMQAIVQDRYGSADVLELREIDVPEPGDGEVLVRVHAAGVDPGVWHLMTGLPYLVRIAGFGLRVPKNPVRGMDLAGTVVAVGRGVAQFAIGDAVFGTCDGSYAEYAVTSEDKLAHKPEKLRFEEAAVVPISAFTALHGIRDSAKLRAGQRALIIGAAGGVGAYAVQIAKSMGAEVTGVCSTQSVEMVRSIGADHVIDYTREDFSRMEARYDVILDTAGNRPLRELRRALTPDGTLVIVGGEGGGRLLGGVGRPLRAILLSPFVRHNLRNFISKENKPDLLHLARLIEEGKLEPVIQKAYALRDAPEAIRDFAAGHARGKIVIHVHDAQES